MKRLLLAGGGTGGHIYPALAVGQAFRAAGADRELLFLGGGRGLESRIVPAAGIPFRALPARGFFGKRGLFQRVAFLWDLLRGSLSAVAEIRRFRPDAVLATGGYASLPALCAALLCRVPIFLLEQNSVPGRAIRLFASRAKCVFISWEEAAAQLSSRPEIIVTGNPLREEMIDLARSRREAGAPDARPLLLIFGGSQGAAALNRAAILALPLLAESVDFEAVLQTGEAQREETAAALAGMGDRVRVQAFIQDMPKVMSLSHCVIGRSGAMTLSEITAMGLPAILVPLPHAIDDHQTRNARVLERAGAALLLAEAELDGTSLAGLLKDLLGDPERCGRMAAASADLGRLDATERILASMEKSLADRGGRC